MSTPSDPQVPRAVFYGAGPPRRRPPVSFLPGDHVVGGVAPVRIIAWRDLPGRDRAGHGVLLSERFRV
jgi:hypothetical protein